MRQSAFRPVQLAAKTMQSRSLSSSTTAPRHLLSIADLTASEFTALVRNAGNHKVAVKTARSVGAAPKALEGTLSGRTVAMMFNKRSTRTRVSTEAAVAMMGGHPMFLGKDDIQLGVRDLPCYTVQLLIPVLGKRVTVRHICGNLVHDLVHGGASWASL